MTRGDAGAVVAVVDSGVQADHPALQGHLLPGWNVVDGDADTADDNGHGTAVAGVVLSACPDCRILPVKVIPADGAGSWATVAAGIEWAAQHGADVIVMSLGGPRPLDEVGAAVADALARGVIVVAAAGNAGRSELFYPAAYPGVVSVAGIDPNGMRYPWSDFGGWISVAAPGCATAPSLGGGYRQDFCGTSTAAPYVGGVAGLARSFRPDLTPAAFGAALAASRVALPDGTTAGGRLDANALLLALGAPPAAPAPAAPPLLAPSPHVGRAVTARPGRWSGAPAYAFSWQLSADGTAWRDAGDGPRFVPARRSAGMLLRVVVRAANARGSATAASAPVRIAPSPRRS